MTGDTYTKLYFAFLIDLVPPVKIVGAVICIESQGILYSVVFVPFGSIFMPRSLFMSTCLC
jgi:hypothetical protein